MDGIDHAAEARKHLQKATDHRVVNESMIQASLAQTHALLALVEQQRLANLLTASQWRHLTPNADGSQRATAMEPGLASRVHLDVLKELGV